LKFEVPDCGADLPQGSRFFVRLDRRFNSHLLSRERSLEVTTLTGRRLFAFLFSYVCDTPKITLSLYETSHSPALLFHQL
jgi:hypothetical protein